MPIPWSAVAILCLIASIAAPGTARAADSKEAPPKKVIVSGIYADRKDNKGDRITFMIDGEDEVKPFTLDLTDKKLVDAMGRIFPNCRVRLAYIEEGDVRRVVAIEKLATRQTGVFIGEVMFVVNNFWVAVKPKNGPPDAFALNFNPRGVTPAADLIKTLKKGDIVAIKFATDFERHRILEMQKKENLK